MKSVQLIHRVLGLAFLWVTVEAVGAVTFSKDIAPIVFQKCTGCHRPSGGGPFNLVDYRDFKRRSRMIEEVVSTRFMPPWHAAKTDVPFSNDPSLTGEEIALIQRWVTEGAPEGDPGALPEVPEYAEGWELGEPDLVLTMDRAYRIPAEGPDIYRYFGFPLGLPEDRWVRALEYRPGRRSVAHHALVFATDDKSWREEEAKDSEIGFDEWSGQGRGSRRIISWAVGSNARVFPEGIGLAIEGGQDLVLQTHFHPSGMVEDEISMIGIYFADGVPARESIEVQIPQSFGSLSGIEIPPGVDDYILRESYTLPVDVEVYAVMPHAHYIGKTFELTAYLPSGKKQELLRVPDWDFAWQHLYQLADRLVLPQGSRIETVIRWDNSADNPFNPYDPPRQIDWGPYSEDEMGSILLDVVAANLADERKLKRDLGRYRARTVENLFVSQEGVLKDGLESIEDRYRKIAGRVLRHHDTNQDGCLDRSERNRAREHYRSLGFDGALQRRHSPSRLQALIAP